MAEAKSLAHDPKGYLVAQGAPLEGQAGAEGAPPNPAMTPEASPNESSDDVSGELPPAPAKEPGSRADSDIDEMSNNIIQHLHGIFKSLSKSSDPAAREFLKARVWEVEAFSHLLQENEDLQDQESQLKAENRQLQEKLQAAKRS